MLICNATTLGMILLESREVVGLNAGRYAAGKILIVNKKPDQPSPAKIYDFYLIP